MVIAPLRLVLNSHSRDIKRRGVFVFNFRGFCTGKAYHFCCTARRGGVQYCRTQGVALVLMSGFKYDSIAVCLLGQLAGRFHRDPGRG